jgi:hypothetical protein
VIAGIKPVLNMMYDCTLDNDSSQHPIYVMISPQEHTVTDSFMFVSACENGAVLLQLSTYNGY